MKKKYARILETSFLIAFVWLSYTGIAFGQENRDAGPPSGSSNPFLFWDAGVGCGFYNNEHGISFGDIEDGTCIKVCEGSEVDYILYGDDTNWQSIEWYVSGGNIVSENGSEISVNWHEAGPGALVVIIHLSDGTQIKRELCIEKIPGPKTMFGVYPEIDADYIVRCLDETIYFTNLSSAGQGSAIVSYFWDFGDGTTSSEFEPSHIYSNPGTYEVVLTVTNNCNCTNSFKLLVKITEWQGFDIECNSVTCEGRTEIYNVPLDIDKACSKNGWDVQGGQIIGYPTSSSVKVKWGHPIDGFGYVAFDPEANDCELRCYTPSTIKVPVVTRRGNIVGQNEICDGEQYIYKLPQWPSTSFDWEIVNGPGQLTTIDQPNEIALTANQSGTIVLRCYYQNSIHGCGGVAELIINVNPSVTISGPDKACEGGTSTYSLPNGLYGNWELTGPGFNDTGNGNSFIANFDGGPGNYTLLVSGANFCLEEPLVIKVQESPDALPAGSIEGPMEICPGNTETYSVPNAPPGTIVVWETGNGVAINGATEGDEVSVTFQQNGSYSISATLKKTTAPFCKSNPRTIVPQLLQMDLEITGEMDVCQNSYETYIVTSLDPDEIADSYTWSINPPTLGAVTSGQGTEQVDVLWYNANGVSQGSLIVEANLCGQTFIEQIAINPQSDPIVTINSNASQTSNGDTICRGDVLSLDFSSSPSITSFGSVTWDFDNGYTSTSTTNSDTSYEYDDINDNNLNYIITLTIEDAVVNGCTIDIQKTYPITVLPAPVALITPANKRYFDTTADIINVNLVATEESGLGNSASIQWYQIQNGITNPIPGANSYIYTIPQDFANYFAVLTHPVTGCTTTTNVVQILQTPSNGGGGNGDGDGDDDGGNGNGCGINFTPNLSINLTNDCGTITASLIDSVSSNPSPATVVWEYYPEDSQVTTSPPHSINVTYTEAGNYQFIAKATYDCTNGSSGGYGVDLVEGSIVIPYIPGLRYSISCGTQPGSYDVTLYDNSNYYPLTDIDTWSYTLTGKAPKNNLTTDAPVTFTNVAPGQLLQATLTIDNVDPTENFPPCTVSIDIEIPDLPQAQIDTSILPGEMCEGTGIPFAPVNVNPDYTYEWQWQNGNDIASVSLTNPEISFSTPGLGNILTLIVTDRYGCRAEDSWSGEINENNLSGTIEKSGPVCEGETITLTYEPDPGSDYPDHFLWMREQAPVPGALDAPTLNVTQPGKYHVIIWNDENCYKYDVDAVTPEFSKPPVSKITGPPGICEGTEFILTSASNESGNLYRWFLNGSLVSSGTEITQTLQQPGIYTYTLQVFNLDCSSNSTHVIEVFAAPNEPQLSFNVLDCNEYTIGITANAGEPGFYTWSNGMTGANIQVHTGGPYQVLFTSAQSGCTSIAEFDIPKHPSEYIWTFPVGCYEICRQDPTQILNPIVPFGEWQEGILGTGASDGGVGVVPPYTITKSGPYQLAIYGPYCDITTDIMHVEIIDCEGGEIYALDGKVNQVDVNGECAYQVPVHLYNFYTYPFDYIISNDIAQGTIVNSTAPLTGTIAAGPGGTNYTLLTVILTIVPDPGFNANTTDLTIDVNFTHAPPPFPARNYFRTFDIDVQPCWVPRPLGTKGSADQANTPASLIVAPNPTGGRARLQYNTGNAENQNSRIELYSISGMLLKSHIPESYTGTWEVNLSGYPDGLYLVVLRKDGKVAAQQKIILSKK